MSGTDYEIRAGDYTAVLTAQAGALRRLRYRGRDLVVPFPGGGPIPDYRGIIAAPWPNRMRDGTYAFDGVEYRVPVNEPERGSALHGFAFALDWTLESGNESSVALSCVVGPVEGYPFALRLTAHYRLTERGLQGRVIVTNTGNGTAPYGVCPHPYLVAGPTPLDEWTLQFSAETFLEVTPDRLLPVGTRSVEGHTFDFRVPRVIGATKMDHAFTDIAFDRSGRARLALLDPSGTGVGMAWDSTCRWLQIHTADKPAPLPGRRGLAVEPMTCPPDAFNSGTDLIRLAPGATHEADWWIFGI
ncbi:MAG: aldose 1-epimerase family protein [Arthrobacter sp.]